MRYSLCTVAATFALVSLAGSWSPVTAQQQSRPRPGSTGTPPATGPQNPSAPQGKANTGVVPVSGQRGPANEGANPGPPAKNVPVVLPERTEAILRQWEQKSSKIKSLRGEHKRTVYNLVFEEEKIAEGKFYLETPDKGRIDLAGITPKKDEVSKKLGQQKKPFKLLADSPERWICTGDEILVINEQEKSYEVVPLPADSKGENIINSPLPFLFGMKAEDAKRRFNIELRQETKETAILIVQPKLKQDQQNYAEAWIILEKENYLPTAVKLFDPTGNLETVYKFENVKINSARGFLDGWFGGDSDPFHPKLKGYKLVLKPVQQVGAQVDPRQPNNQRPVDQAGARDIPRTNPGTNRSRPAN